MNEGSTTMDLNLYLLKDNLWDHNFMPNRYGLVNILNVYKISMENETYSNNGFLFKEALNTYGTISSLAEDSSVEAGAFSFADFYLQYEGITLLSATEQYGEYPGPPIYIQSSFYISITSISFSNNYFAEMNVPSYTSLTTVQASAIAFVYCKANLEISSLTFESYNGLDMDEISAILGTDQMDYIGEALPNQRSTSTAEPVVSLYDPYFYVDYGTRSSIFHFYSPSSQTESNYDNIFYEVNLGTVTIEDVVFYPLADQKSLFGELLDNFGDISIDSLTMGNVECELCSKGIFYIQNAGSFVLNEAIISTINYNAYNYNTSSCGY